MAKSAGILEKLNAELRRLVELFGCGSEFKVAWRPGRSRGKEGEVVGDILVIYAKDPDRALEILRHEFVEALLVSLIARATASSTRRSSIGSLIKILSFQVF